MSGADLMEKRLVEYVSVVFLMLASHFEEKDVVG